MQKSFYFILLLILCLSCKKYKESEKEVYGSYILRLTDSPGEYDHLYIDIQQVSVNVDGIGWVDVGPQAPGIYDILSFDNGMDTLLVNASLPVGTVNQIRLKLGTNNSVVISGISHNLIVASSEQSGIKLNVNTGIYENSATVEWMDFDAGKSVIELGNGSYRLKPVLHSFSASNNGRINGMLLPAAALAHVEAIKGSDTLVAIPEDDGFFQFSGLQGNYKLRFVPSNQTYSEQTLMNNQVSGNQLISIGTITLQ